MPNVNYRGKPSQDPNAPPESGMTSIPLGAPWPPLSREQVVKLHEGLTRFRRVCRDAKDPRSAALELCDTLDDLGIGSPPPKTSSYCAPIFEWADRMKAEDRRERWDGDPTWAETETMLRRVIYALRGFMCGWDKDPRLMLKETAASEGLALLALLRDSGIESLLPKHMSLIGIPTNELPSWPKDWVEESSRIDQKFAQAARLLAEAGILTPPPTRTWTHEEVAKVAEEVQDGANLTPVEPAWLRLDWGSVQMPVRNLSGQDLAEGQIVTTAQVQVAPQKRNCWTCKFGHTDARYCRAMPARKRGERDSERHKAIGAWTNAQNLDTALMPPKDSDGCPGWEPKP